jgi:hypothetical protein
VQDPSPQLAGPLGGLLPLDLPALERGVQHLFARLASLEEKLSAERGGLGFGPWFVTVGAATMLFELARRQLQRQALGGLAAATGVSKGDCPPLLKGVRKRGLTPCI